MLIALASACSASPGVTATESRSRPAAAIETVPAVGEKPSSSTTSSEPSSGGATSTSVSGPVEGGDRGVGDVLFPALGNPGIDVQGYTVRLDYDPQQDRIAGTVNLDVLMTEVRTEFSLDSDGPLVSAVSVDGAPVAFVAEPPELVITLPNGAVRGQRLAVEVTYTVDVQPLPSAVGQPVGWFNTPGGSYVLNEPEGAHTWLPSNDHPSDKAAYRFEVTVPSGLSAVANGSMVEHTSTPSSETWIWQEDRPMATYMIQLLTGDYETVEGSGPNGLPLLSVVLREDRERMQPYLDSIDDQIDFFDDLFGPFPLDRYGIAITDSFGGLAMETLGRSLFSRDDFASGRLDLVQELYLSHELAHQWFGDAVTPARWTDIWLSESFATYGHWLWLDHVGTASLEQLAESSLALRQDGSTASPAAAALFATNSYEGGAVILHALRRTIGDDAFFTVLRRWVEDNNGSSRTTDQFVALATEVAGRDLSEFFDTWLYATSLPDVFPG